MRIKFQLDNLQKCFQCLAALEAIPPHSPSLFGVISNGPNDRVPRPQYGWTIWKQKEIEDLVRVNAMEQAINGLPKEDLDKKATEDEDTRFRDKAYLLLLGRSESDFVDMAVENVMGFFFTARPSTFCSSTVNATYEEDRIEFDRAVEYLQMVVYKSHMGFYMGILFEGCSQAKKKIGEKKIGEDIFNKHWRKTLCNAFYSQENFDSSDEDNKIKYYDGKPDKNVESASKSFTLKYIHFLLADMPERYQPEEVWKKTLDGSIPELEKRCTVFAQELAAKHGWNRDLPKEYTVITPEAGSSKTLSPAPSAR